MSAVILPLPETYRPAGATLRDEPLKDLAPLRLPRLERIARRGSVLHPSPLANQDDVLSLNLAQGCAHRCAFCSVRAAPKHASDDVVYLYEDTVARLAEELAHRHKRPRAVYISPSTDPFPPSAEVQAETVRVVEVLAAHHVDAWMMTRGFIRPSAQRALAACRDRVKVTIGLLTLDRAMQRALEPLAAPPRLRLRQIAALRALGISVQVALEPLIPGVTDTRENLAAVLEALASVGIRRITAGYMFLRAGIRDNLIPVLEREGWAEMVLDAFEGGPVLSAGAIAPARYLPKPRRQRGYAALMALAADMGMTVSVSGLSNPDFQPPRRQEAVVGPRQRLLPSF